jgi:hypothetical protein
MESTLRMHIQTIEDKIKKITSDIETRKRNTKIAKLLSLCTNLSISLSTNVKFVTHCLGLEYENYAHNFIVDAACVIRDHKAEYDAIHASHVGCDLNDGTCYLIIYFILNSQCAAKRKAELRGLREEKNNLMAAIVRNRWGQ